MPQPQPQAGQVQLQYVDHPDVSETFADNLEPLLMDGQTIRLEFTVNRVDRPNPPATAPISGSRHTACRVVLPAMALMAIASQINGLMAALQKTGALKLAAPGSPSGKAN
jgi:hypothetical protein